MLKRKNMTKKKDSKVTITKERPASLILDGLSNVMSGMGTGKDIASHNQWNHTGRNLDHLSLSARYREDWISQKICSIIPQDMTREWRKFDNDLGMEADKAFDISNLFQEAYKWARLYGTSFIVLDIDDGRSVDKPVLWDRLGIGCLKGMTVVDRTRIVAVGNIEQDPQAVEYGLPTFYQFVGVPTKLHKSRIIRFEGTDLPIFERQRNLWYSDSVLIPFMDQIDRFHSTAKAANQMVNEANVDVLSIPSLGQKLANDDGSMLLRFSQFKQMKSVYNIALLDSEELYEQKNMQLSGIKDFLWQNLEVVAAMVGIPTTRFLSVTPSGLSNTGHADIVNYVDLLRGLQEFVFNPRLEIIDTLLSAHFGLSEEVMIYEWACIFPESSIEKAERLKVLSESLSMLCAQDVGILSRESALQKLKDEGFIPEEATIGEAPPKPTAGDSSGV